MNACWVMSLLWLVLVRGMVKNKNVDAPCVDYLALAMVPLERLYSSALAFPPCVIVWK